MSGGSSIRAVGQNGPVAEGAATEASRTGDSPLSLTEDDAFEDAPESTSPRAPLIVSPVAAGIALLALIGWTAFFVIARSPDSFVSMDLSGWSEAITAWAIPALLIVFVWHAVSQRIGR